MMFVPNWLLHRGRESGRLKRQATRCWRNSRLRTASFVSLEVGNMIESGGAWNET